jgi:hypothetical protein
MWFKYCPKHIAHGLVPLFANPACVTLSVSEAYSRCTSATFPVHRSIPPRLPPVLPPLLRCHFLFFITPAPMQYPMGRWHANFAWHPGSECRTQPIVISDPFRAKQFLSFIPAQRLGFSRTLPLQWCLSTVCLPADTAFRPRNAEPAHRRFLPASLAPPAFHGSTLSGSAGCLHCQILLLLSRHPAFHGRSLSLYIASSNHPAACGTWSRLVMSRWTIYFPKLRLMPILASALLALAVAPTINSPSLLYYCRPFHQQSTHLPSTLYIISRARPPLITAVGHQRGTLPLHRRACILLSPAPHFAPPTFTRLPFRNRSLRPASRHNFSALTILSTPHPSDHAVRPPFFSKSYFSASHYSLALTL